MHPIDRLLNMMAALRDPDSGCPWDKQQDFSSIAPYTIEEAYEVADAIESNDMNQLCNELGDLLFQVVYHAQLAAEKELFDFNDVVSAITRKIESRHPHVFSDAVIESAGEQSIAWEQHKHRERQAMNSKASVLDSISHAMPALSRAQKLQQRAAVTGFDWPQLAPVMEKLHEELGELTVEIERAGERSGDKGIKAVRDELGDLLFSCVNLARHLQIDAEAAVRATNRKFEHRFRYLEKQLNQSGNGAGDATIEEMEALWQQAKQREE